MLKDRLNQLQNSNSNPSVSILLPTHKTFPENQQDSIRLKNLIADAKNRLNDEFDKETAQNVIKNLNRVTQDIDFNYLQEGLAIYVNSNEAHKFTFPFTVEERLFLNENFAIKDIVFMINRTEPYWLVLINEKESHLYYCIREDFTEIKQSGFPVYNQLREGIENDMTINEKVRLDPEKIKIYMREIDSALKKLNAEGNEIIVSTINRYFSFFKEVTSQKDLVAGNIKGSYDKADISLMNTAWKKIQTLRRQNRKKVLEDLGYYIKNNLLVSGIDEAWQMAVSGRIEKLLVEINYKFPVSISEDGIKITAQNDEKNSETFHDAVNEIINIVINKGGKVVFYKDNELNSYNKIVALLRY